MCFTYVGATKLQKSFATVVISMITYLPINQQVVFGRFTERSRRWLRSNNHLELLLNPYRELQQKKAHRSPSKLRSSLPEKVHKSRTEYTNQRNLFDMEINNNHYSIIPFTKRDPVLSPFFSPFSPSFFPRQPHPLRGPFPSYSARLYPSP